MIFASSHLKDIESAIKPYPALRLISNGFPEIVGTWHVQHQGEILVSYEIRITFDAEYPHSLPKVYEVSGKIARSPDMHLNPPDWHACLFVSHQRWEIWPIGSPFGYFLDLPVHNFFLGQAHYAAIGYWPDHRERSHGDCGIIEYYREKFNCLDPNVILNLLTSQIPDKIPRQRRCLCDKQKRLKYCHGPVAKLIQKNQEPVLLRQAIEIFRQQAAKK